MRTLFTAICLLIVWSICTASKETLNETQRFYGLAFAAIFALLAIAWGTNEHHR
jgi:hypothetical protein